MGLSGGSGGVAIQVCETFRSQLAVTYGTDPTTSVALHAITQTVSRNSGHAAPYRYDPRCVWTGSGD